MKLHEKIVEIFIMGILMIGLVSLIADVKQAQESLVKCERVK